jgi:hypothetical protein
MSAHTEKYKKIYKNLKKYLLNGGSWNCDGCTYLNHDDLPTCEICNTAKPVVPAKPFYIYTTGIADWNKPEKIIDKWILYVCDNVLKQIPVRFNEIHIIHSDTLETLPDERSYSVEERRNITQSINRNLCPQDMLKPRVRSSVFTDKALDFSSLRTPHIVIDMAHLFNYTEIGKATLAGRSYKIHAIYVGYFGEDAIQRIKHANPMYSLKIASTMQLFRVLDDDTVETYIDRLIKLKYKFNPYVPSDFFYEFLTSCRKNIINMIRPEFRLVTPADEKIIDDMLCNTTLPALMIKVMNEDMNYDKLYYQLLVETIIIVGSIIYQ